MAGIANSAHINTDRTGDSKGGGNYETLADVLNRKVVDDAAWNETTISANGQFALINATGFPGTVALGVSSEETTGGLQSALLAGAIGTAATTSIADSRGRITNIVSIRDATSHDSILDTNGREIKGLLQAASTVTDGDPVGASGSENLQVSFVTVSADSTLTLVTVTASIELRVSVLYSVRHLPAYMRVGGGAGADIIDPDFVAEPIVRHYVVTAAFEADEVITVSTGAGGISGASTPSGDTITSIGVDAATFNNTNSTRVRIEGQGQVTKGVNAIWDSATTYHVSVPLSIGDRFSVEMAA